MFVSEPALRSGGRIRAGIALIAVGIPLALAGLYWPATHLVRTSAVIVDSTIALSAGVVLGVPVAYEYTVDGVHCRSELLIPPSSPYYGRGSNIGSSIPIYVERSQPCINYALRRPILTTMLISGACVLCIGLVVVLSARSH
jgi:hypothetical protein